MEAEEPDQSQRQGAVNGLKRVLEVELIFGQGDHMIPPTRITEILMNRLTLFKGPSRRVEEGGFSTGAAIQESSVNSS